MVSTPQAVVPRYILSPYGAIELTMQRDRSPGLDLIAFRTMGRLIRPDGDVAGVCRFASYRRKRSRAALSADQICGELDAVSQEEFDLGEALASWNPRNLEACVNDACLLIAERVEVFAPLKGGGAWKETGDQQDRLESRAITLTPFTIEDQPGDTLSGIEQILGSANGDTFWCHVSGRTLDRDDPHASGIWSFEDLSAQRTVKAELTGREREVAARLLEGLDPSFDKKVGKNPVYAQFGGKPSHLLWISRLFQYPFALFSHNRQRYGFNFRM